LDRQVDALRRWSRHSARYPGRSGAPQHTCRRGPDHRDGHSATVKLDTGPDVAVDILFAHPRNKPSASLHESLGLATVDTPLGIALKVDERRETSMPGIYAAGDLANPLMPSVTTASWQGAMAGIFAQQSMLV
jgi:thioredoxin reductase